MYFHVGTQPLWHSATTLNSKFGLPNKILTIKTTDFATSRAEIYFFTATSAKCADQL
jgi:hypothetical protein